MEDATVFVVVDFFGGVDAGGGDELLFGAVGGFGADGDGFAGNERGYAFDLEDFVAGEAEALAGFALLEFERENAHTDEVAAMDAFVAFGDDGAGAEEARAFRGPISRRTGPVLMTGENN